MHKILIVLIFSCLAYAVQAQEITLQEEERDTTTIAENTFLELFKGKPGRAAFYGLIIPGGGQIYNRDWWKLPIAYGIEGFLVYRIINTTSNYNAYQDAYLEMLKGERTEFNGFTSVDAVKRVRDGYRKEKEFSYIYFLGGRLLVLFEAFIDRHLSEFDVSDDLSINIVPSPIGTFNAITYTYDISPSKDIVFKKFF